MKKKNFIVGFSAAVVALITLASCGGLKGKNGVVLKIGDKEYTAEELFDDQKSAASAEAKFNAVYKVAVRRYFEDGQDGHQYITEITRDTKNKISGSKAEAQSNASKNGTSYDTEWNKILKNNSVDDEAGLYDKYEYDLMKSKFEEVIYENNYDVLRKGGKLKDKDGKEWGDSLDSADKKGGYLSTKQPYHMKHILVKVSAKDKDNVSGEITKDEANKIYKVVSSLAKGETFESVSQLYNDDATAKKSHGSLGIMSRDTSFVNDFKLGTYMYEAFYGSSTQNADTAYNKVIAKNALGLNTHTGEEGYAGYYADKISKLNDPTTTAKNGLHGIGQIPYGIIEKFAYQDEDGLDGIADLDFSDPKGNVQKNFSDVGLSSTDVKAKYLPRNVIFNKYFNKHNLMVITPTKAPVFTEAANKYIEQPQGSTGTKRSTGANANLDVYKYVDNTNGNIDSTYIGMPGFNQEVIKNGDTIDADILGNKQGTTPRNNVLRDNNGRVIFVFRSGSGSSNESNADGYQGIHFVVIERSPFIDSETDYTDDNNSTTSLEEYYTQYFPMQTGSLHPKYTEGKYKGQDKYTFTNYIRNETEMSNQKARADTVKTELKKADDNLNTYIYSYLMDKGDLKYSETAKAKEIDKSINDWIKYTKRDASKEETEKKWNETWETYYNSLESQFEQRNEVEIGEGTTKYISTQMIPEICVDAFSKTLKTTFTLKELFGVGGIFYDQK